MKPAPVVPGWKPPRTEVYRGNGIGLVLAGIAMLILVSTLLMPWWTYAGQDGRHDSLKIALAPGTTYVWGCYGYNCTLDGGSYTYSSTGLSWTGSTMEGLETDIGVGLFVGMGCFLTAMIAWVDRARAGAVRMTIAIGLGAALVTLAGPVWLTLELPGTLSADGLGFVPASFSGGNASADWGPTAGWGLAILAAVMFLASAIAQWTTLRYAKSWDAPLYEGPPIPSRYPPPVTTPPDRLARLDLLRKGGTITDADLEAQRARILAPESLDRPIPIPPNAGSRNAALAHLEYLRSSRRYDPEQLGKLEVKVLRAYGLSPSLLFPEEELHALVVRLHAGSIGQAEFEQRKKEILDTI